MLGLETMEASKEITVLAGAKTTIELFHVVLDESEQLGIMPKHKWHGSRVVTNWTRLHIIHKLLWWCQYPLNPCFC